MSFGGDLHKRIFEQELSTISVAGVDIPVKFGISALEEITEKYGTLTVYEQALKGLVPKKQTAKQMAKALKDGESTFDHKEGDIQPVIDGIIAMIHCGCLAKKYDLTGVTDDEIIGALDLNYHKLRMLVMTEFNRNFVEPDEAEKK